MAKGTMANYTGTICVNRFEAPSWGIQTYVVNGATELFPGFTTTQTGNTFPDVAKPDADLDVFGGVCITDSGISIDGATKLEIDSTYPDNEPIEVARPGSHLICWMFVDDDEGALVLNTAVYHTGVDADGFIEKLDAIDVDTAFNESDLQSQFDILTNAWARYVGRLYKNIADQGSTDTPEKVILC